MKTLAAKFAELKKNVGGNREKLRYEDTFGMPKEMQAHVSMPSRENTRILGELEFALHLNEELKGQYDGEMGEALDMLLAAQKAQGVINAKDAEAAENILAPMEKAAKEYKIILVGHAHIDMNWMWGYNETVAITLATFRSVLNVMNEYPEFCFSQSQGSVYKIVEEFDPEMMEEIKARIREGRWEVNATGWVENDKNMPAGESLLRQIEYTREYLKKVWEVPDFDVDFSPDTFGHCIDIPEIDTFGEVKYFYHCRGNYRQEILYRYKAPSGKDILTYREPNWYNGAITNHVGAGAVEVTRHQHGLKTCVYVYGVGDHGGGPTRRDVERAIDMQSWKIYPEIRFGTLRDYFHEAEKIREQLPVVDVELNFFANGCYTTQSRIKRGNRILENKLLDTESMAALAGKNTAYHYPEEQVKDAWRELLFTHFHDLITGSCKQDSREHAMGLFQHVDSVASSQLTIAMRKLGEKIDTSSIGGDIDAFNSQSEGAGPGYGIDNFVGVPSTERGSGLTRVFQIYNTLTFARKEVVELTVWDWLGDLNLLTVCDCEGNVIPSQNVDNDYQNYWDHKFIRVLVEVSVPALGYTTIVLKEKDREEYPVYLHINPQITANYDDIVLENGHIRAVLSANSGRIVSLVDKASGMEMIGAGSSAGLNYLETEDRTSSAWNIGRTIREYPVDKCVELKVVGDGSLRKSVKAEYEIASSKVTVTYSLDSTSKAVKINTVVDWNEVGKEIVPVLTFRAPLSFETEDFRYDIPAGTIVRRPINNDVPGTQYGMAMSGKGTGLILISDCKYGYRGQKDSLTLTLINSSVSPDPYPERGIHTINMWLGTCTEDALQAEKLATVYNRQLIYAASNVHGGDLPMQQSLIACESSDVVISAVQPAGENAVVVRGYEVNGKKGTAVITVNSGVKAAESTDLFGAPAGSEPEISESEVRVQVEPYSLFEVKITF